MSDPTDIPDAKANLPVLDGSEERSPLSEYPHMDGGFIVIGPECFAKHDGSVLSWKGVNYVPQKNRDNRVETQVQKLTEEMERDENEEEDDLDSCARPARIDPSVPQ